MNKMAKRKKTDSTLHDLHSNTGKISYHYQNNIGNFLERRRVGERGRLGDESQLQHTLYSAIRSVRSWNPALTTDHTHHGAIFNFDFSSDGSILGAACEHRSILLFDPHNGSLIGSKDKAHTDCVNCIRFLDSRTFATCSDDATVCLWDVRHLKHRIHMLQGHSNWVKNIEYASEQGLLVTSGFDGSIYTWDINKYSEGGVNFNRVFHTNGLMRSKLVPDATKLVITTTHGFLMVIHDLDLMTLSHDLQGFKPSMYRMMQVSRTPLRQGYSYNHLFTRKRNRVELITDFPPGDEADMIASLEIHPQGWCIASRNTTEDDNTEWTCVHDIQDLPPRRTSDTWDTSPDKPSCIDRNCSDSSTDSDQESEGNSNTRDSCPPTPRKRRRYSTIPHPVASDDASLEFRASSLPTLNAAGGFTESRPHRLMIQLTDGHPGRSGQNQAQGQSSGRSRSPTVSPWSNQSTAGSSSNFLAPSIASLASNVPFMTLNRVGQMNFTQSDLLSPSDSSSSSSSSTSSGDSPRTDIHSSTSTFYTDIPHSHELPKIHQNIPRLTHYTEEPNVGRGFIKEIAFSSDGRLICSPFGFGVRLLSFDSQCRELCDCSGGSIKQLHEVATNMSHTKEVVTTKFSPTHCLLVTGCLRGKVDFHQPVL